MKRLIATLFAASLTSSAFAAVGFEYGAVFFQPRLDPQGSGYNWTGVGQSFAVTWGLENGLLLGVYTEATDLNNGFGSTYPFQVNALSVGKEVVRNASVGIRVGSFYEDYNAVSALLVDVLGSVTLISGQGGQVSGNVKAHAGGRFANSTANGGENWSGFFAGLSVGVGI